MRRTSMFVVSVVFFSMAARCPADTAVRIRPPPVHPALFKGGVLFCLTQGISYNLYYQLMGCEHNACGEHFG
ncbi:hypothetical protein ES703_67877 [subsurface metagenome]